MSSTSTNKNNRVKLSAFKTIFLLLITFLICDIGWSQSYTSREGDSINSKFYVWAGVFYPNMNTSLRVDSAIGIGTEIGLENDLNLEEDLGVFRIDGLVQLTENSQLALTYTAMKRNRRFTLEKDIEFGDTSFEAGSNAGYEFNVDYVGATYRYNFFNERNWSAGLSGGLRGVIINTSLEGQLNDTNFKETAKFTAPAILFGVHGSAYLTPRLLARYSLEAFYLKIDDIKINIVEANASVHYFIFKNVGLGLAYSTNNYRVQNVPLWGDSEGKIDFNFGGLNMYLTSRF
ncbi:MAG: hypothetical protein ACI83B_003309 [Sediminicola sp.]|jgi:hypothetical protein|tara:strand:+ start:60 stop:926 length:867 start_codon:yes stop_codon:yes gene_type:complete